MSYNGHQTHCENLDSVNYLEIDQAGRLLIHSHKWLYYIFYQNKHFLSFRVTNVL